MLMILAKTPLPRRASVASLPFPNGRKDEGECREILAGGNPLDAAQLVDTRSHCQLFPVRLDLACIMRELEIMLRLRIAAQEMLLLREFPPEDLSGEQETVRLELRILDAGALEAVVSRIRLSDQAAAIIDEENPRMLLEQRVERWHRYLCLAGEHDAVDLVMQQAVKALALALNEVPSAAEAEFRLGCEKVDNTHADP